LTGKRRKKLYGRKKAQNSQRVEIIIRDEMDEKKGVSRKE